MSLRLDSLLWLPKGERTKNVKDSLTIQGKAFVGSGRQVQLYVETDNFIGVPRTWGLDKSYLTVGNTIDDQTTKPRVPWPRITFPDGGDYWKGQRDSVNAIVGAFVGGGKYGALLEAPCGTGKGHPVGTKVLGPCGWKCIGDLKVGDCLVDPDTGGMSQVIGVYPRGKLNVYRVTFTDRTSVLVDDDHLWQVQTQWERYTGRPGKVLPTYQLRNTRLVDKQGRKQWYIPLTKPIEGSCTLEGMLHPYLLGVLLGDGGLSNAVGGITLTSADSEILNRVQRLLPLGVSLEYKSEYDYYVTAGRGNNNDLVDILRMLGLMGLRSNEKFIPKAAEHLNVGERIELLQGLLDTDGEMGCGTNQAFCYSSTSEQLAKGVAELIRSLGGTATQSSRVGSYKKWGRRVEGSRSYRLYCQMPDDFLPFKLSYKLARYVKGQRGPSKAIVSIEPEGRQEVVCIAVNSRRNLYITEGHTVTHNTLMGLDVASRLGTPTLIVVHKGDLAGQWHDTAKLLFSGAIGGHVQGDSWDWENKHYVTAMAQTLFRRIDVYPDGFLDNFGLVIFDEGHRYPAKTFEHVLRMFPSRYRLAVSATWKRRDGLECIWHWHVGHIEHRMRADRLTGTYTQIPWSTSLTDYIMKQHGRVSQSKWLATITTNVPYNIWLADQIISGSGVGRRVLCVSDRIEHLLNLREHIYSKATVEVGMYVGAIGGKRLTKEQLEGAKSCPVILATYGMMAEGTDIPALDTLFLATPRADVEQVIGRIQRPKDGKRVLLVVDPIFLTNYNRGLGRKRKKVLDRLGFKDQTLDKRATDT